MFHRLIACFTLFLCALSPGAFAVSARAQAAPSERTDFVHDFGAPGEPGSFRVLFDAMGAGIWKVWLLDHYTTAAVATKEPKAPEDYFALAFDVEPGFMSMVLDVDPSGYEFPRPLGIKKDASGQRQVWEVEKAPDRVSFRLDSGEGLVFEKVYRHDPKRREIVLELRMEAAAGFQRTSDHMFATVQGLMLGPEKRKVQSSVGSASVESFIAQLHDGAEAQDPLPKRATDIEGGRERMISTTPGQHIVFAGTSSQFFAAFAYAPDEGSRSRWLSVDAVAVPSAGRSIGETVVAPRSVPRAFFGLRLDVPSAGEQTTTSLAFYLGPKSAEVFDEFETHEPFHAIMDVDLEPMCCGVPLVKPLAKGLLWLLRVFHSFVGSWGFAIMVLTLLVRGSLVPLNFRMQKSMRAYSQKMAVLQPKLKKIQEQHADNKAELQKAMMEFQREHKIMPPLGGCLPIFLTMPIYIGLFTCLRVAYDLRHQSFFFVDDLSQPDALFAIPLEFQPVINIMPLIWMGLFWLLTKNQPLPDDPQQRQIAKMMRLMPLIFGVMLFNYPAALMVYMITSAVWGMLESRIIKKILGPMDSAGGIAPMPVM